MSSALTVLLQLLPALAGGQTVPVADTLLPTMAPVVRAPLTPSVGGPAVDWQALREGSAPAPFDTARTRKRTRAIEYGSGYHTRLVIHRWLSFAMVPLFIGSYVTGDQILKKGRADAPQWARTLHGPFAAGTGIVFGANTITGTWNLWVSRKDPVGRTKRIIHSLLFVAADAGFAYSGISLAHDAKNSQQKRIEHRNVALASMGVSVTSWALMLFFK
jgi:hypothetical protein